jgi:hypothetical protein
VITGITARGGLDDRITARVLRYSFATTLVCGDTDLVIAAELLGHARLETRAPTRAPAPRIAAELSIFCPSTSRSEPYRAPSASANAAIAGFGRILAVTPLRTRIRQRSHRHCFDLWSAVARRGWGRRVVAAPARCRASRR